MNDEILSFEFLKSKQRKIRNGFGDNLSLRVHRALSWLQRGEMENEDMDASFIFYWISFNAAYAKNIPEQTTTAERDSFSEYFKELIKLDQEQIIYNAIWEKFSGPIQLLLKNQYVFAPFWNHQNGISGYADWEQKFEQSKRVISSALRQQNTQMILTTMFSRLYVLRNQLVHGGSTWNSSVNRSQVQDGAKILAFLMPIFINLMMDNPTTKWGVPHYLVVD